MCFRFSVIVIGFKLDPYSRSDFTGMDRFYKNNYVDHFIKQYKYERRNR